MTPDSIKVSFLICALLLIHPRIRLVLLDRGSPSTSRRDLMERLETEKASIPKRSNPTNCLMRRTSIIENELEQIKSGKRKHRFSSIQYLRLRDACFMAEKQYMIISPIWTGLFPNS